MPLVAGLPVVDDPTVPQDPFLDTRTLSLRSLDGMDVLPFTGSEFIARWGMQGMDLPPREIVIGQVPGMDGGRVDEIKIGPRRVFLPVWFGSDSGHLAYLDKRDGLRSLFDHHGVDLRADEGAFDLVANSRDGDEERTLRCFYESGMDGNWAQDSSGTYWETVGLNLVAVRTYWHGEPWATAPIYAPVGVKWLGPFPGRLSSSRALGANIPVQVTGHVPSWVRVDATGPASSVQVTAPGLQVSIPGGLAAGEKMTLITSPRGRTARFNGIKDWTRVGPATRWRPLPVGQQTINVVMPDATSGPNGTMAVVSGNSLYESPW